jgi:hypothetical protein
VKNMATKLDKSSMTINIVRMEYINTVRTYKIGNKENSLHPRTAIIVLAAPPPLLLGRKGIQRRQL